MENNILDSGRSDKRRLIHLETLKLPYDYVPSFFTKVKKKCWRKFKEDPTFVQYFSSLGSMESVSEDQFQTLEKYVYLLYGNKLRNVDNARNHLSKRKNEQYNKFIDLALLPPCQNVLRLHSKRANFVAYLWEQSLAKLDDKYSEL